MTSDDRKALVESVARYRRYAEVAWDSIHGVRLNAEDCGLCDMYIHVRCSGCPVKAVTAKDYCEDTPYDFMGRENGRWSLVDLHTLAGNDEKNMKAFHKRCKQEADFLQSLLDNDPGARKENE